MRTFVSTDLTTPVVTSWRYGAPTDGLLVVDQFDGGYCGLIMDDSGEPVLTFWSGTSNSGMAPRSRDDHV
ncbi:hypothetical protein [Leekyejoonella antrihumi]|uniref:Uncharacterized protein n=1 Tax=Leekyejoonella antrihumi TaxID=1660198 RepID=A0A563E126_9MICO|nr:hypothetical protein [Leekyejoonella antrihumi]TWP36217.1 hypothetical protein FGL98_11005 [Leekyejoonella antrihumi]